MYYTTRDVQRYFGVSHTTAYRLMRRSNVEVLRLGRNYRLTEEAFNKLIEQHTETMTEAHQSDHTD